MMHLKMFPALDRRGFLTGLLAGSLVPAAAAPKIRVGCQTRAYGSPIPDRDKLLSALDDLRATGYEGFETNYRSLEHSFQDPAPMRAEIEKRGIVLIGLHLGAKLFDAADLKKEHAQIRQVATAAKALGGAHLMLSVRTLPRDPAGHPDREVEKRRNIQLNEAGRACRELGIRLATHNHLQQSLHNAEELTTILGSTDPDYVSLLLDVAYTHRGGVDTPAFVRRHGRRIAGFHLRDVRGDEEVIVGAGEVDLRGLGRALADTGWSGWCILEINRRPDIPSRELIKNARAHLRRTMNI